jgi:dienelactone hydrolase
VSSYLAGGVVQWAQVVLFTLAFAGRAAGQTLADAKPGETLPKAISRADATMSYSVHLPASYNRARKWPIVFLLDPRGRAEIPLQRMRAAAEQYGYILISSFNTLSDSTSDVNVRAMNAMLTDAQTMLSVDTRRFYLAGFSGTARIAWDFAAALPVAGIFGTGASGLLSADKSQQAIKNLRDLAFYGAVGETDFNYEEMRLFETWLQRNAVPHRVRYVPGGHGWPADSVFADAIAWFELRAMRSGLIPADSSAIRFAFVRDTTRAADHERAGGLADAMLLWREIARDYGDDGKTVSKRADELSLNGKVRRTIELQRDLHQRFIAFNDELRAWVKEVAAAASPPDASKGIRKLQIERRLEETQERNREVALAARRELEHALVSLSFYEPRQLLAEKKPAAALALLGVAERIRPGNGATALHSAYAYVQLNKKTEAVAALKRAVASGIDPHRLLEDPWLVTLKDDAAFRELIGIR